MNFVFGIEKIIIYTAAKFYTAICFLAVFSSAAKVFKLKACELQPQAVQSFSKKVSLKPMTTRTLYAGLHKVDVIVNGESTHIAEFELA